MAWWTRDDNQLSRGLNPAIRPASVPCEMRRFRSNTGHLARASPASVPVRIRNDPLLATSTLPYCPKTASVTLAIELPGVAKSTIFLIEIKTDGLTTL